MSDEEKRTSKSKLRRNFTAGIVVMVLLLGVLNFQIASVGGELRELNNALSGLATGTGQVPPPTAAPEGQAPPPTLDVDARDLIGDSPTRGDLDAPVVLIGWNDFRCGFCGRFKEQTLPSILETYVETGQVLYVFKHFPVVGGEPEALASHCANEQGAFWEFHDLVFEANNPGRADFVRWAEELGMDVAEFETCVDTRRYEDQIAQDAQAAMSVGIQGTPGFLINDVTVSGAQPFENFRQVIEAALAN